MKNTAPHGICSILKKAVKIVFAILTTHLFSSMASLLLWRHFYGKPLPVSTISSLKYPMDPKNLIESSFCKGNFHLPAHAYEK
jgi:hypothetical protein